MTTQENVNAVFEKMKNKYKTKIASITNTKETKQVLISKISELLTADNKFSSELSNIKSELIFKTNGYDFLSFRELKTIIKICESINGLMHYAVEFKISGRRSGIMTLKNVSEYSETEFNRELKIVSVHIDYSIC